MLLGTFKTVFNSVFLVPTKTNTLHRKAMVERQETQRQTEENAPIQTDAGGHVSKHYIHVLLVGAVHANLV